MFLRSYQHMKQPTQRFLSYFSQVCSNVVRHVNRIAQNPYCILNAGAKKANNSRARRGRSEQAWSGVISLKFRYNLIEILQRAEG